MGDPKSDDYYKVLGVGRDAGEQEISKAYRKAAVRWHPDKNPGDTEAEENFKRVAEAYDCLSNKEKRESYDRFGKAGLNGQGGSGGMHTSFNQAQAEEIFKSFFGAGLDGLGGMEGFSFQSMEGGRGGARMMFTSMGGMPGMGGMGPEMMFGMGGMPGMGAMPGMGRGGRGRSVRPKRTPRFDEVPPKTRVSISGLQSAPQHNGKTGRVVSYDAQRGRYTVVLDADSEQLAVKPDCMHQVVGVEVADLGTSPDLNGTEATIVAFDEDRGRYHVKLHDGRMASLGPHNVVLPPETRCSVSGLESAAAQQYNGARGKIVSYDADTGRYEVMVSESNHLRLKRENVLV